MAEMLAISLHAPQEPHRSNSKKIYKRRQMKLMVQKTTARMMGMKMSEQDPQHELSLRLQR